MPKVASEAKVASHSQLRALQRQSGPAERPDNGTQFAALLDTDPSTDSSPRAKAPSRTERAAQIQASRRSDAPDPERRTENTDSDTEASAAADTASADAAETQDSETAAVSPDTSEAEAPKTDTADAVDPAAIVQPAAPVVAAPIQPVVAMTVDPADGDTREGIGAAAAGAPADAAAALPEITEEAPAPLPQAPLKTDAKQKSAASATPDTDAEDADAAPAATPQAESTQLKQADTHHNKARANAPALQEAAATQHRSPADKTTDTDIKSAQQPAAAPGADPAQSVTLPPLHMHAASSAVASAGTAAPLANAIPLAGVALEIAAQVRAGNTRFEIRLDPPELGRIDVRLDVDRHGHVTSRLLVDRPETLDMLRRDAASLERALQDAGLKTSDNALNFSLRDQSGGQQDRSPHADPAAAHVVVQDDTLVAASALQNYDRSIRLGGLDIRV